MLLPRDKGLQQEHKIPVVDLTHYSKSRKRSQYRAGERASSLDNGAYCASMVTEFDPWSTHKGKGEPTLPSCPLTSTRAMAHMPKYAQHAQIKQKIKKKLKANITLERRMLLC